MGHDPKFDDLRFCVAYALKQYGFARPRGHDQTAHDRYFAAVAKHVLEHLRLCGYTVTHGRAAGGGVEERAGASPGASGGE